MLGGLDALVGCQLADGEFAVTIQGSKDGHRHYGERVLRPPLADDPAPEAGDAHAQLGCELGVLDERLPLAGFVEYGAQVGLFIHHGTLPYQDPYLARFGIWIDDKLLGLPEEIDKPVAQFATSGTSGPSQNRRKALKPRCTPPNRRSLKPSNSWTDSGIPTNGPQRTALSKTSQSGLRLLEAADHRGPARVLGPRIPLTSVSRTRLRSSGFVILPRPLLESSCPTRESIRTIR